MREFGGYLAQYNRVVRHLALAAKAGGDLVAKEDECINVFLHAWALKDHIRKDPRLPADGRDRLYDAAHSSSVLKIAQQIANGTKHLTPYDARMVGHNDVAVFLGSHIEHYPLICFEGAKSRRAIDVAEDVVGEWERLFAVENIALPQR